VLDGDTLALVSGQRVRLIGLNAPETHHHQQAEEPFAELAKAALQELIRNNHSQVSLVFDHTRKDRHARLLAHVFDSNGHNLSEEMIERGLAARATVMPNQRFATCYQNAELRAKAGARGIWSKPAFWNINHQAISPSRKGFVIVQDSVESVKFTRKSIWINLTHGTVLRVAVKQKKHFKISSWRSLKGRTISARGWLRKRKNKPSLLINHPLNLAIKN
jgi:endonuclease YncB( thermonuclease family)